jgi:PTH1 family peptidyl-tRNA hydrolase
MKVVVGLGNPGSQYVGTRHNVGFAVVETLAQEHGAGPWRERFHGLVSELPVPEDKVLLVKPLTYMNASGRCVQQVVAYYQLPLDDLLVVCDDFQLPLGKLRFRSQGSHGGHNGLRDIQERLGTTAYPRLRIGVGPPPAPGQAVEHVLSRFRPEEQPVIEEAVRHAVRAVADWWQQGLAYCMNHYN